MANRNGATDYDLGKVAETKPSGKKSSKYPGMGYTLFVRPSASDIDKADPWFECILCAPHEKLSPKEMSSHLKRYSHVWNVLMLECPNSSSQFEGNGQKTASTLSQEISEFLRREVGKDDVMATANLQNAETKRKDILANLDSIRAENSRRQEASTYKLSDKSPDNQPNNVPDYDCDVSDTKSQSIAEEPMDDSHEQQIIDDNKLCYIEDLLDADGQSKDQSMTGDDDDCTERNQLEFIYHPANNSNEEECAVDRDAHLEELQNCAIFEHGSKGMLNLLNMFEMLQEKNETFLKFLPRHPFFFPLKKTYLGTYASFSSKRLALAEQEFLESSLDGITISNDILLYDDKYLLPNRLMNDVLSSYHDMLHHLDAEVLFQIMDNEFYTVMPFSADTVQSLFKDCNGCTSIPSSVQKAYSKTVMEAYNCWPRRRAMRKTLIDDLVCTGWLRSPKKIIIIGDERDSFLKDIELPENVSVQICAGLTFENAFDYISCDPSFNGGVLYVMLAGALGALSWKTEKDCGLNECQRPLLVPGLVKHDHIELITYMSNSGRNLLQAVLVNSSNDLLIFGHMVPFDLKVMAAKVINEHNSSGDHSNDRLLEGEGWAPDMLSLSSAFKEYNAITDCWSDSLQFPCWDLSSEFFNGHITKLKQKDCPHFDSDNHNNTGIEFSEAVIEQRKKQIQEYCHQTIERLNSTENFSKMPKNVISHFDPILLRNEPVTKFDKVVLFCESESRPMLEQFTSNQVLLTDCSIDPASLADFSKAMTLDKCHSLWIFTSTVAPIANKERFFGCGKCTEKIPVMIPNAGFSSDSSNLEDIEPILDQIRNIVKMAECAGGEKCVAVVLPIIPVLVANAMDHESMHEVYSLNKHIVSCTYASISQLLPVNSKLYKESLSIAMSLFRTKDMYPFPLERFCPIWKDIFRLVCEKETHIPALPIHFEQMVKNVIYSALTGYPANGPRRPTVTGLHISQPVHFKGVLNRDNFHFKNIVFVSNTSFSVVSSGLDLPFIHKIKIPLDSSKEQIQETMNKLSSFRSQTVWIYLLGHDLIADRLSFKDCQTCATKSSNYLCLKNDSHNNSLYNGMDTFTMVQSCATRAQQLAMTLQQCLSDSSCLIVIPLCCSTGILASECDLHSVMHDHPQRSINQEFLVGCRLKWHEAIHALNLFVPLIIESTNICFHDCKMLLSLCWPHEPTTMIITKEAKYGLHKVKSDYVKRWTSIVNEICSTVLQIRQGNYDSSLQMYFEDSKETKRAAISATEKFPSLVSGAPSAEGPRKANRLNINSKQFCSVRPPQMYAYSNMMSSQPPNLSSQLPHQVRNVRPPMRPGQPPIMGCQQNYPRGAQPPSMRFGPPFQMGLPGNQPQMGPFGHPPQMGPFGQPPQMVPPGHPPQMGPFGQPPPMGPPGQPPPMGPYGHPPRMGPYGHPPRMGHHGQPPPMGPHGLRPPMGPPRQQLPISPYGQPPPMTPRQPPPMGPGQPSFAEGVPPMEFNRNFSTPTSQPPPQVIAPGSMSQMGGSIVRLSGTNVKVPPPLSAPSTSTSSSVVGCKNIDSSSIPDKTVKPEASAESQSKEFRVLVGKIPNIVTDECLSSMLALIGHFLSFKRPKVPNVSYGVAKFLSEKAAEKAVRVLDNFPIMGGIIEVRLLYYTDKKMPKKLGISVQKQDDDARKGINNIIRKITDKDGATEDPKKEIIKPTKTDGSDFAIKISLASKSVAKETLEDISSDEDVLKNNSSKVNEKSKADEKSKAAVPIFVATNTLSYPGSKSFHNTFRRTRTRSRSRSRSGSSSSSSSPYESYSKKSRGRSFAPRRGYYPRGRSSYWQSNRLPKAPPTNRPWSPGGSDRQNKSIYPYPCSQIKIYNYSRVFNAGFLDALVMACGSPRPCIKKGFFFLANFTSVKRSVMVTRHLNNKRLVDRTLKVEVLGRTEGVTKKITTEEDVAISKEIDNVYEEYQSSAVGKLQAEILKDPDIFTFHIFPCEVINCRAFDCHYYHGLSDKRRDYLKYKYTEKMCPYVVDGRPCPQEDWCIHCHSQVERLYHPKSYKSFVCLDWYEEQKCINQLFCPKAHPLSNDSFFTEAWKDVFVAGLDKGFLFFAGALKMFYKVVDSEGGVPVIFLSPMIEICHLLLNIVKPVSRIHRLKAAVITEDDLDPAGADVLLSTPAALAALIKDKGSAPLGGVCVLVFDDITNLINNPTHATHLHSIIDAIYKEVNDIDKICKVVASETCHPSEIEDASSILKTKFHLCNPFEIDQAMPPCIKYTSPRTTSVVVVSDSDEKQRPSYGGRKGQSTSKRSRRRPPSSSSSNSSSSDSSAASSKSKRHRLDHSESSSEDSDTHEALSTQETARMRVLESEANAEIEESFSVYLEVPEMHPEYENRYGKFLRSYKKKYGSSDESQHLERIWQKYWKISAKNLKAYDMKKKKEDILKQIKADRKLPSTLSSGTSKTPDKNSIIDNVAFLENICEYIEGVGTPLQSLLNALQMYGVESARAISLLKKEDSINIMQAAGRQLSKMIEEGSNEKKRSLCTSGLSCVVQLIKHAKALIDDETETESGTRNSGNSTVRFDVDVFARQTFGQDDAWVYSTLEKSLEYAYSCTPAVETLHQIFADVKKLHLVMRGGTPVLRTSDPSQETSNTPRPLPKQMTIPLTPLISHLGSKSAASGSRQINPQGW